MMNYIIEDLKKNKKEGFTKLELSASDPKLNPFYNKFNPSNVKKPRDENSGDDFTYLLNFSKPKRKKRKSYKSKKKYTKRRRSYSNKNRKK